MYEKTITLNHPDGSTSTVTSGVTLNQNGAMIAGGVTVTDHKTTDEEGNPKISVHVGPAHSEDIPGPMPVHLTDEEKAASVIVEETK